MANSDAFEKACALLEELSTLSRLEARGTIRIALKQSGLNAATVVASELAVVVRAVLPNELERRGVEGVEGVADGLIDGLAGMDDSQRVESPESVFSRLGG